MPDPASPLSSRPDPRPAGAPALDGEVFPPALRVVGPEPRSEPPAKTSARPSFRLKLATAVLGLTALLSAAGAGAVGTYAWHHRTAPSGQPNSTTLALSRLGRDVADLKTSVDSARQDEAVRSLKKSVDQLKAEFDGLRGSNSAAIAQLTAKLDKPAAAAGPALADVAARLDKLDHDPRLADMTARLDRIERQVSSPAPTGTIAPPAHAAAPQTVVAQTSAPSKPTLKPAVLDNWIVRDVYSGIALVEGRSGSVREVVPGEVLPGAGEVRSIQRHGRGWVVVTSRGIIDTETW
jgi:hypothetical protein